MYTHTVMAKNIGTLAILSENATLLSENCSNCFGIHMLIVFVCTATTQKKTREEKSNLIKFHTELKNGLDKMIGTLSKL